MKEVSLEMLRGVRSLAQLLQDKIVSAQKVPHEKFHRSVKGKKRQDILILKPSLRMDDSLSRLASLEIFGQFVAPRQNQVDLRSASRLERWIVSTLSLLDILVKKSQTVRDFGCHLGIFVNTVVNQLLKQSILHVGVGDETVDKPGEQGAGRGKPSTSCNN